MSYKNKRSPPLFVCADSDVIFYDKVTYYLDSDFWTSYNIIEPTESLDKAVLKLKKKNAKVKGKDH